ncbi:SDR family NAD(P)-dependent oxidoreductase [Psychromarinibacter sp. C21-152]|uniref:SDR family NAD(P)-dependent oxidoreductase n=1 Tax=Psychromarinibacter sediminicola TaxID=3033385 RepID=A0AAE3NSP5_9RHOB|nr:SDR family oxidoreductase [Psychromarinibacter sediminicola]MDF0601731.1 SDR family NAD(P)-dependent oxidoreductase [Psychromarinibacter sediminicola]
MNDFTGKRVFVTGAAGGIGRAIAAGFAEAGASVGMADIKADLLADATAEIPGTTPYETDVADRAAVFAAVDDFAGRGGLDVMVNNAVLFHYAPLVDMPEDVVDRMLDIGIKGSFWGSQAATPHLVARGGGLILNMSSVAVSFAIRNAAVYTSIKGAMDAVTRQQAIELAPHRIRVNALAPGTIVTPGTMGLLDEAGWKARSEMMPMQRMVTDREIAEGAMYLASDGARGVTGISLKIDGGFTIVGPR